ncbi:MAG: c-type cytochrome domain-containing protein [Verrucomicrobiota bacterium]
MTKNLTLVAAVMLLATNSSRAADKWDVSKYDTAKLPPAAKRKGVTYAKDIRPLFEASCFRCHGENQQKGGLRLDSLESILEGGKDGKVVVTGKSAQSAVVLAAAQIHDDIAMPPKFRPGGSGGPRPPGDQNRPPGPGPAGSGPGGPPPGGGPGGRGGFGPPPKPLTTEQVGLLRAWVDGGAK